MIVFQSILFTIKQIKKKNNICEFKNSIISLACESNQSMVLSRYIPETRLETSPIEKLIQIYLIKIYLKSYYN